MGPLRAWYGLGTRTLLSRLAGVGACAGFFAWALFYYGHDLVGADRPTLEVLFWAMVRGALFGVLLGIVLVSVWKRRRGDGREVR